MGLHMDRAGKCAAGPCTERRGQVRAGPSNRGGRCTGGALSRFRREGQICGNGAKHETSEERPRPGRDRDG